MSRNLYNFIKQGYNTYFEITKCLDDIAMFLKMYYKKHPRKLTNEVLQENMINLNLYCFDSKPLSRAIQDIYYKGLIYQKRHQNLPFSKIHRLNISKCMPTYRTNPRGFYSLFVNVHECVFIFSLTIPKNKFQSGKKYK